MKYDFKELIQNLENIQAWLKKEYSQISTGRANPVMLDSLMVDSYGSKQPIKNIASINTEDARTLRIAPWDKTQIKDIEKAFVESKLPFALGVDDQGIRATLPQLTEESKKTIVKLLKEKLEEARVKTRAERNDAEKDIEAKKKASEFGEDEMFRFKEELQKHIDTANTDLEAMFNNKEADIMKV